MTDTNTYINHDIFKTAGQTGLKVSTILSTECRSGRLVIREEEISVGISTPLQQCDRDDKVIYITEGKLTVYAGGRLFSAEKGVSIFIAAGDIHRISNTGTMTGKALVTLTPTGTMLSSQITGR